MKVYCNPLNIAYQYQHYGVAAHRESADPTMVYFKGRYYIFASMSAGFFHSTDRVNWEWHENRNLDLYRYAPDAHQIGEYLVFCASCRGDAGTFYRTADPLSDVFEKISEPFPFWDPALFEDEDGRVYLYWGCSDKTPLYVRELDRDTLMPVGEKMEILWGHPEEYGWDRLDHPGYRCGKTTPFIEGAFVNKIGGLYYLQYAAPGTEFATYCDGVYVGKSPMGPFVCQQHNPMSLKTGGFITGAGHGSTIWDEYGNLWHCATMRVSVNAPFERRIGLFPAGVDEDGQMYCNQNYADWPIRIPEGKFDLRQLRPEWMLVSWGKKAEASDSLPGFGPEKALNEDIQDCWCAGGEKAWYRLDLGRVYDVGAVQINFADVDVPLMQASEEEYSPDEAIRRYVDSSPRHTRWLLEGSVDGDVWQVVEDKTGADGDLCHDCVYPENLQVRYLKLTVTELPYGKKCALSGLRVFARPQGPLPGQAEVCGEERPDEMTVRLRWKKAENAVGYNIRYGIAPDKLYLSHMVYGEEEAMLTALRRGRAYWYCVDSFGEGGITPGRVCAMNGD